ncbi:MAG: hypothetical protein WC536_01885 [Patescibacteria group bacterium]
MDQSLKNNLNKPSAKNDKKLPLWLRWVILIALVVLIFLLLFLLIKPLRTYSAQKYITEGDQYLANKEYLHADLAYDKALTLFPSSKAAEERKTLNKEASQNVLVLEDFYKSNNFNSQKEKLDEATAFPTNETEAVKLSKQLIEENEYQLAIIPAKTATEMAPDYKDAWIYLGISNLKTAELADLTSSVQAGYISKAKEAFEKAKQIDPESKTVDDYLDSIDKL